MLSKLLRVTQLVNGGDGICTLVSPTTDPPVLDNQAMLPSL